MGLNALVDRLNHIRGKYLPYDSRFIFGLDEVQRATRLYHCSFVSSNNDGVFQSIICKISKVFTKSPIKLVVSGTDLPLAEPEEAMVPRCFKTCWIRYTVPQTWDVRHLAENGAIHGTLRPRFYFEMLLGTQISCLQQGQIVECR